MSDTERHISKPALEKLFKAHDIADDKSSVARAEFKLKLDAEKRLDKFAYGVVRKLNKMDPAKAANHIRALMLYIDMLGLAAQMDLEDVVEKAQAEASDTELIKDILANGGQAALKRFEEAISGQEARAVKRELDKRIAEWPELSEQLDVIAEARLRELRKVVKLPARKHEDQRA